MPLCHRVRLAQVDFAKADVYALVAKLLEHCVLMLVPHSDVWSVRAYPAETTPLRRR